MTKCNVLVRAPKPIRALEKRFAFIKRCIFFITLEYAICEGVIKEEEQKRKQITYFLVQELRLFAKEEDYIAFTSIIKQFKLTYKNKKDIQKIQQNIPFLPLEQREKNNVVLSSTNIAMSIYLREKLTEFIKRSTCSIINQHFFNVSDQKLIEEFIKKPSI